MQGRLAKKQQRKAPRVDYSLGMEDHSSRIDGRPRFGKSGMKIKLPEGYTLWMYGHVGDRTKLQRNC